MYYSLISVLLISVTTVLGDDCDKRGVLVYEDLGCTPEKPKSGNCPEKFNCPNLVSNATTCAFKGKLYQNREEVDYSVSSLSCNVGCHCDLDSRSHPGSKFSCAILECPEQTGHYPPPNCYSKYTLDHCCADGNLCFGKDDIATCEFDGKTYNEGNQIWPADTCLVCVCQKGWTGKLEAPFCRRQSCGTQLTGKGQFVEQKCAPIYSSKSTLCCPDNWVCPDGTEKIEGEVASGDAECQFGNTIVKKGQSFEKTNIKVLYGETIKKVKCECTLPPLLTCHTV